MTNEKTIENFLEELVFDDDFYDVYYTDELLECAKDFICDYDITIRENCDYRNDQDENGNYYCDIT